MEQLERMLKPIADWVANNRMRAIGIFVAVWAVVVVITILILAAANASSTRELTDAEKDELNERLQSEAEVDTRLMTRGKVLSTKDNTPMQKIPLYSKRAQQEVTLDESIFSNLVNNTDPIVPADISRERRRRATNRDATNLRRVPEYPPMTNTPREPSRSEDTSPAERPYERIAPRVVPGTENDRFDEGGGNYEPVLP